MKKLLLPTIIATIILSGCSSAQTPSAWPMDVQTTVQKEWSIELFCSPEKTEGVLKEIEKYSSDIHTTNLVFMEDCSWKRISTKILDAIAKKSLHTVHMQSTTDDRQKYYLLDDQEVRLIAQWEWKWLWIDSNLLRSSQYKILRNEKPAMREWFEPNGDPNIYSAAERTKCGWAMNDYIKTHTWGVEGDSTFQQLLDESVKCYRDLPPIR